VPPVELLRVVLLLLAVCVLLALAARKLRVPPAAAYVVGGIVLALLPGVPPLRLDPDLVLTLFLPPLLTASAFFTDWRAFRANLRPILLLAVGCVVFTTVAVACVAKLLVPGLPWAACFALGAIVSPPDAVAAGAVLSRLKLPRRLVVVLEGESLVNDASGLVLYRFAVAAALSGTFSPAGAVVSFVLVAVGGIAAGLMVGWCLVRALGILHDTSLEIAASFLAAWASYIVADEIGVSGVLSTVACGLLLGQRQHEVLSPRTRLEAQATWHFATFVLEALVFVLIGFSLHSVLGRLGIQGTLDLLPEAAAVTAAAAVARPVWVFPATYLPRLLIPALRRHDPYPPLRMAAAVSWAGMRGVVSLAAALALPEGFPGRDGILLTTFVVIVVTVLGQGTTLGPLLQAIGITGQESADEGESEARAAMAVAQLRHLEARRGEPEHADAASAILPYYRQVAGLQAHGMHGEGETRLRLRLDALHAGRAELLHLHRAGQVTEPALQALERELDLEEARLRRRLDAADG